MRENAKVPLTAEEAQKAVLSRLIACLNEVERTELIGQAFRMLAGRCSFDPYASSEEQLEEEQLGTGDDDLDWRIFCVQPWDWPGQAFVGLDGIDDPGAWFQNIFPERITEVLFGSAWHDEETAEDMAVSYLKEMIDQGYPVPSDFCDIPDGSSKAEADFLQVQEEFRYFLQAWRGNILKAIEKTTSVKNGTKSGE